MKKRNKQFYKNDIFSTLTLILGLFLIFSLVSCETKPSGISFSFGNMVPCCMVYENSYLFGCIGPYDPSDCKNNFVSLTRGVQSTTASCEQRCQNEAKENECIGYNSDYGGVWNISSIEYFICSTDKTKSLRCDGFNQVTETICSSGQKCNPSTGKCNTNTPDCTNKCQGWDNGAGGICPAPVGGGSCEALLGDCDGSQSIGEPDLNDLTSYIGGSQVTCNWVDLSGTQHPVINTKKLFDLSENGSVGPEDQDILNDILTQKIFPIKTSGICEENYCCMPDCSDKCPGADNDCNILCTINDPGTYACCVNTDCQSGQVCNPTTKQCECAPDCTNKCDGTSDGCGGTCSERTGLSCIDSISNNNGVCKGSYCIEPSLKFYANFDDGTATDLTGNIASVIINGPVYTAGINKGGFQFSKTTDCINLNNPLITNNPIKVPLPISISAWINPSSVTTSQSIVSTDEMDNCKYAGVQLQLTNLGRIAIQYGAGDKGGSGPFRGTKIGTSVLAIGNWYHVVGVINGLGNMDIYINGVNNGGTYSGSAGSIGYSTLYPSKIGNSDSSTCSATFPFNGVIDNVRIYNRSLTSSDVQSLYQTKS